MSYFAWKIGPFRAASMKPLGRTHSNNLKVGLFSEVPRGPKSHTELRQEPRNDVPKGPGPGTPKSIFPGPILARRAAGHKMLKKPPRPSNSGARMRGPRRRRVPSFEVVRPSVSVRGTSRFPFKRVTVWWTRGPFFDILTPKQGRTFTGRFRPTEGIPPRQIFQFRLDPTLANRVHETARPNPFKSMASGIFFRNVPGAQNSTRWLLGPPPRASHRRRGALGRGGNREPPAQNLSLCPLCLLHTQSLSCDYKVPDGCFFSRGPMAPCFRNMKEGPLKCHNLKSRGPKTYRLRTGDVPLPI